MCSRSLSVIWAVEELVITWMYQSLPLWLWSPSLSVIWAVEQLPGRSTLLLNTSSVAFLILSSLLEKQLSNMMYVIFLCLGHKNKNSFRSLEDAVKKDIIRGVILFLLPSCMILLQLVRVKRSNDWKERLRYIHFTIPFPSIFYTLRARIAMVKSFAQGKTNMLCTSRDYY